MVFPTHKIWRHLKHIFHFIMLNSFRVGSKWLENTFKLCEHRKKTFELFQKPDQHDVGKLRLPFGRDKSCRTQPSGHGKDTVTTCFRFGRKWSINTFKHTLESEKSKTYTNQNKPLKNCFCLQKTRFLYTLKVANFAIHFHGKKVRSKLIPFLSI